MNVEPELLTHPKFLRLEKRVGEPALKILLRLWGHCAANKRGEFWRGANAEYVETVALWSGQDGFLYGCLKEIKWLHERADGVVIHDWEENNSFTVANWARNPYGRRGRTKRGTGPRVNGGGSGGSDSEPVVNPTVDHGLTNAGSDGNQGEAKGGSGGSHISSPSLIHSCTPSSSLERGEGRGESGDPLRANEPPNPKPETRNPKPTITQEAWLAAAAFELTPEQALDEWNNQERKPEEERWKGIDPARLRQHAAFVRSKVHQRNFQQKNRRAAGGHREEPTRRHEGTRRMRGI